jgi:hypothetical protein
MRRSRPRKRDEPQSVLVRGEHTDPLAVNRGIMPGSRRRFNIPPRPRAGETNTRKCVPQAKRQFKTRGECPVWQGLARSAARAGPETRASAPIAARTREKSRDTMP